jgi:hypothetical protein
MSRLSDEKESFPFEVRIRASVRVWRSHVNISCRFDMANVVVFLEDKRI